MDFGEITLLKRQDVNNSRYCFLVILNGFSEGLSLFKLIFFLNIGKYFDESQYFMGQVLTSEN